jgi:hypothetical protein
MADRKNCPIYQTACLQPFLSVWLRPPHFSHCPGVDINENHTEKSASGYVKPKEHRRNIDFQPHGGYIDENTDKRQYNEPETGFVPKIHK